MTRIVHGFRNRKTRFPVNSVQLQCDSSVVSLNYFRWTLSRHVLKSSDSGSQTNECQCCGCVCVNGPFVCVPTNSLFVPCDRKPSVNRAWSTEIKVILRALGCLMDRYVSAVHIVDITSLSPSRVHVCHGLGSNYQQFSTQLPIVCVWPKIDLKIFCVSIVNFAFLHRCIKSNRGVSFWPLHGPIRYLVVFVFFSIQCHLFF